MGSIYRRTELVTDPATGQSKRVAVGPYQIKYHRQGRPFRESTKSLDMAEAKRLLKVREGQIASGTFTGLVETRLTYDAMAASLRRHFEITGSRNLKEADCRLKPLHAFFSGYRAKNITRDLVARYVRVREDEGLAAATINRELLVLKKMLRLAVEDHALVWVPRIKLLKEAPPRQGFFEQADFEAVRSHLRPDLQVAITIMYRFGWRLNEVMTLTLSQVDLEWDTLRLSPGSTKNGHGRVVALTAELHGLLAEQIERVAALQKRLDRIVSDLFPHLDGRFEGQRIRSFDHAWDRACRLAGLGKRIRHDFRRSAVRNMVRLGVSEHTAMRITGHRSRSVFDRYDIVSDQDLKEASRKLSEPVLGTIVGTLAPVSVLSQRVTTQ